MEAEPRKEKTEPPKEAGPQNRRRGPRDTPEAIRNGLKRVMRGRIAVDLRPYEGEWLSPAEVEKRVGEERRRARVRAVELILIFAACTLFSVLLLALLKDLAY